MDQIVEEDKNPILIKIDVEGHENEVLEGGIRTIREFKPLLIIESFPPKQANIIMTLKEIGYKVIDADMMSVVQDNTANLFAWHPQGPIEECAMQNIFAS